MADVSSADVAFVEAAGTHVCRLTLPLDDVDADGKSVMAEWRFGHGEGGGDGKAKNFDFDGPSVVRMRFPYAPRSQHILPGAAASLVLLMRPMPPIVASALVTALTRAREMSLASRRADPPALSSPTPSPLSRGHGTQGSPEVGQADKDTAAATSFANLMVEANDRVTLEIWRIEALEPALVPPHKHGVFYKGDAYLVLTTGIEDATEHEVFFWVGSGAATDEKVAGAIHARDLAQKHGARVHREEEGDESDDFRALFWCGTFCTFFFVCFDSWGFL